MDIFERENLVQSVQGNNKPLADRIRPESLEKLVGQDSVLGKDTALYKSIENDTVPSLILWGPPGTGKTTLAEIIARTTKGQFVRFSAVTSGIKEVKTLLASSGNYFKLTGKRTYVFVDEIHRFNKAQQDAFLPYVENGDVVLIGATTENPSFEVNSALLSRMQVVVLKRLSEPDLYRILDSALSDKDKGLGAKEVLADKDALMFIAKSADGDGRRALAILDEAVKFLGETKNLTVESVEKTIQESTFLYDRNGEEHYNIISALHKSIRGGDPDASLYWLARMLVAGEDRMYILRRLIRIASEDVGLADPFALTVTINARDSFQFLGKPEGDLAIAQAVIYLAVAPKSNSAYNAFKKVMEDAKERGSLPVPLWIRNAPTKLMKKLGYGKEYKYSHDFENCITDEEYLPAELAGKKYYLPKNAGREVKISEYLTRFNSIKDSLKNK